MERPATTVESQTIFRQYADGGEVNLTRQQPHWQLLMMGGVNRAFMVEEIGAVHHNWKGQYFAKLHFAN